MNKEKISNDILGKFRNTEEPENEDFVWVNEEQVSFDGEKGFVELEVIYQRKSDEKYFKVEVSDRGYRGGSYESDLEEVVQKQKMITYYE